jgi:D-3-phosphoglycerate dehydrogenase
VPLTEKTRMILNREALAKTRPGVRIINCARGGLVDETALADAIRSGHVAGAGFDVFETEPATASPLFDLPGVVVTPHLGAATSEAQENVAIQVAEQISDYLLHGAVSNAINMPSINAEEAPRLTPWVKLATHLGAFVGQMTEEPITAINILYNGAVAEMNVKALNAAALAGLMQTQTPEINMISAPVLAKERGINVSTTTQAKTGVFDAYMKITVVTGTRERSIAGTVYSDGKPRFIQIKGITIDAEIGRHMLYTTNKDRAGIIGTLGNTLGQNGVNIANFTLGRSGVGGDAIALLYLDERLPEAVRQKLLATGMFQQVRPLEFDIG